MTESRTILYIHGMGGGGDSRIPSILRNCLSAYGLEVIVRTYDFNPDVATGQIRSWMEELRPELVIGESLGSIHAIAVQGVPHILVSPSLNGPLYLALLSPLSLIPGIRPIFNRIYRPKEGDRQKLNFSFKNMRHWGRYRKKALANSPIKGGKDYFYAFFGTRDHYRKSGIVRIRTWEKHFGRSYTVYEGTHFMEEEYLHSLLVPKILEVLRISSNQ